MDLWRAVASQEGGAGLNRTEMELMMLVAYLNHESKFSSLPAQQFCALLFIIEHELSVLFSFILLFIHLLLLLCLFFINNS